MEANKYTLEVTCETLCPRSMPALLRQLADELSDEFQHGTLVASDGDRITWNLESDKVEF